MLIMKKKLGIFKYFSLVLLLLVVLSIFIKNTNALLLNNNIGSTEKDIVDIDTYNKYNNIINENNIGKIWTDKSVYNEDLTIDNKTIKKDEDEDFLVSLSALSVGIDLNIKEGNVKDIVILQDLSSSMQNNNVYTGSGGTMTRLQSSKNAINNLLELIAKANDSLSSEDEKFRVSLISFAGQTAAKVRFDLTEVGATNLDSLKSSVNNMSVTGNTWITPGLNLCSKQIQNNGRKNVDSAIISFLDGLPDESADGNNAIATAKELKQNGVIMYSIIVNDEAKGGIDTLIDKIGQGISSNYDNASSTSSLGTKTGNTYYYIPKTANDLINSFNNIIKTIQKKDYTLEKNSSLTFIDKLGYYMEVRRIKALSYNGDIYTKVSESIEGNVTNYKFAKTVVDSFGNDSNINTIDINVTKSNDIAVGDTITVTIPYNLVPIAVYDVKSIFKTNTTVYTTVLEEAKPISLIYSSNVKNDVYNLYRTNDLEIKDYINKNGYIKDFEGYSKFYSNYYNNEINGTTEVKFEPYSKNNYYYYEEEVYLYTKNGDNYTLFTGNELSDGTYYIKKTIYKVGEEIALEEVYEEVKNVKEAQKNSKNQWYFSSTKKEVDDIVVKEKNETETAHNLSSTNWNNKEIKSLLGNNGVILLHLDIDKINIKINKVWNDSNNKSRTRPKSITIRLKRNGEDLGEEYKILLNEENNWNYTYENLPLIIDGAEMKYTIEEEKVNKYNSSIEGSQETGFTINNTLIVENPYTGFKAAIIVIVLSIILIFVCYYFRDKRNKLYKI